MPALVLLLGMELLEALLLGMGPGLWAGLPGMGLAGMGGHVGCRSHGGWLGCWSCGGGPRMAWNMLGMFCTF